MKKYLRKLPVFLLIIAFPISCFAARTLYFETQAHLVWMMITTCLVLFMTIPGIVLFYGGMVQRKNVLSIYAQCITIAAIISIIWFTVGYSFTFSQSGNLLTTLQEHFFLNGFGKRISGMGLITASHFVSAIFQMGFAIITVAIIVGGFAERMKFSTSIIFAPLWLLIVYCPIAHWVWAADGWLHQLGALDFAGGTVVHLNAGIAGLIAAIMVGQRRKIHNDPYSLSLVTIGTSILWIGWFGFNAGSAKTIPQAVLALLNTQLGPAAAALGFMAMEWIHRKKPSARGLMFGIISGLVAITPAAGYCTPIMAILIGIIVGPICYWSTNVKNMIGYDDALDAFGIHGIGGILGSLLTGVVASTALNGIGYGSGMTLMGQVGIQALAVIAVLAWSGCCTFVILWILKKTIGLRVEEEVEIEGLDYHEHGETL